MNTVASRGPVTFSELAEVEPVLLRWEEEAREAVQNDPRSSYWWPLLLRSSGDFRHDVFQAAAARGRDSGLALTTVVEHLLAVFRRALRGR